MPVDFAAIVEQLKRADEHFAAASKAILDKRSAPVN